MVYEETRPSAQSIAKIIAIVTSIEFTPDLSCRSVNQSGLIRFTTGRSISSGELDTASALLWCSAIALQHLTRTMAIACVLRLVAKHHRNAEPINMSLSEY